MVSISVAWIAGWVLSSVLIRCAPLSRISRAVMELPRASFGSETANRPTRKSVVCRAVSASVSARTRSRSAWLRASHAAAASPEVIVMPTIEAVTSAIMRRCRRCSSRCFNSSNPTPRRPAISLSSAFCLPSPCGSGVRCDGFRRLPGQRAIGPQPKLHGRWKALGVGARLAVHDQAEDAALPPETLVGQDLLVGPARLRGVGRADDDLARRVLQRLGQFRSEAVGGRQLLAVAEYLAHLLRHGAHRRHPTDEVLRHLVRLERLVQPGRPLLVLVAVADERAILVIRRQGMACAARGDWGRIIVDAPAVRDKRPRCRLW